MSKMITITAPKTAFLQAIRGLEEKAADYLGRAADMLYHGEVQDKAEAEDAARVRAEDPARADAETADYEALRADRLEVVEKYRAAWRDIMKLIETIRGGDASDEATDWLWDRKIKDALHWAPRDQAARGQAKSIIDIIALHANLGDRRAIDQARGETLAAWSDAEGSPLASAVDQLRQRLEFSRLALAHAAGTTEDEIASIEAGGEPALATVKTLLAIARDAQTMTGDEIYERYCPPAPSYIAPLANPVTMTGDDVRDARGILGHAWGLGRPLHKSELGRALQLSEKNANKTVHEWEMGKGPTGPAATAIQAWLDAAAAGKPVKPRTDFRKPMGPTRSGA